MTRGKPKRPAAIAVVRSANFLFWFSDAQRDGIDEREAHAIGRYLKLNHAALERIDVNELAAGQLMTSGSIDRNLRGRLGRVDRLYAEADYTQDDGDEPTPVMRFTVRTSANGRHNKKSDTALFGNVTRRTDEGRRGSSPKSSRT